MICIITTAPLNGLQINTTPQMALIIDIISTVTIKKNVEAIHQAIEWNIEDAEVIKEESISEEKTEKKEKAKKKKTKKSKKQNEEENN